MRSLAALAIAAVVLAGTALTSVIASHSAGAAPAPVKATTVRTAAWLGPVARGAGLARTGYPRFSFGGDTPLQTTPVATATLTGTVSPTPTATATTTSTTTSNLPDASTLLSQMAAVLQVAKSVHFKEVALQTGATDIKITDTGDTTCTGLGVKAHVVVHADVPGTSQVLNETFDEIRIKNKEYWKSAKHTHGTWQPTTEKKLTNIDLTFQPLPTGSNPLGCFVNLATGGTSGTGGGVQQQVSGLTNAGETTFNKQDVYDLHFVVITLDTTTNQTTQFPVDYYVGKAHPILYGTLVTFNDNTQNVQGTETQYFSKYGEKFKVTAPTKGSTKP